MPLDPDFDPIVAALEKRPKAPVDSIVPSALRAVVESAQWPTRREDLPRVENLSIDGEGGAIRARFYAPRAGTGLPLVLFVHGGGFVVCSIDTHDNYCRALAKAADCAVLSIDYRLAPEHRFPAAADDVITALNWCRAHAAELGCDPARLAIAGDSAGANLAAVAALHTEVPLRHMLLLYPVVDPEGQGSSWTTHAETPFLSAEMMRWFWAQYLGRLEDRYNPRVALLRNHRLDRAPESTIVTAEYDPLCSEGEAFAQALAQRGVKVDFTRCDGVPHGFATLVGMVKKADQVLQHSAARLRAAFAAAGAPIHS